MTTTLVSSITQGTTITFRSKNPNDTTTWIGVLEMPVGSYKVIKPYLNPAMYNEAVRQADPTVSSDVTALNYFIITVSNNSSTPTEQVFAQEWISPGSLNIVTLGNIVKVNVEDPLNNSQAILSLLANAGYVATLAS